MELQSGEQLLELMRGYQLSSVLAAAVDTDLFGHLGARRRSAAELADAMACDLRGLSILLDALAAVGLLDKTEGRYGVPTSLQPFVSEHSPQSVIPMLRHQSVCLRRWAQLPWTVRDGVPAQVPPSLRGEESDQESFIQAMHVVSREVAPGLVTEICPDTLN